MEKIMVTVPLEDFNNGIMAMADLDSIRSMITDGGEYCSSAIMAVLGLEKKKDDGTD